MKTNEEFSLELENFSGPLDLLLYLINKNKVDIYDIPIVEITDQYIAYLANIKEDVLETMSEFLIMASTLIAIKTKMLVPRHEEVEEDPRTNLVEQILEYQRFKRVAQTMSELEKKGFKALVKSQSLPQEVVEFEPKPNVKEIFKDVEARDIKSTFLLLMKQAFDRIDRQRSEFSSVNEEVFTIEEQMGRLRSSLETKKTVSFQRIISSMRSKLEIVVTFLALLEMVKLGEVFVEQRDILSDIDICVAGVGDE